MNAIIAGLMLLAAPQQDPREEYEKKVEKLKDDDARGHGKLADWCNKRKLWDLALEEYKLVLELDPKHRNARKALGYKKKGKEWQRDPKIEKLWTYRSVACSSITFPDREELDKERKKGKNYAHVIAVMLDPETWVAAIRAIDERMGLFDGEMRIRVVLKDLGGALATGGGTGGGRGKIDVDIVRMAQQIDDIAQYKRGQRTIPPSPIPLVFMHELVHCFQGVVGTGWLLEGVPSYVAQDPHFIAFFQEDKVKTDAIEGKPEDNYDYARGWAFFEYIEAKFGREKVRTFFKLFYKDRKGHKEALEEATGKKYADLVKGERAWSASWLRKYKIKK